VQAAALTCPWYSVSGSRHVQVILVRDRRAAGYDLALVTTDLAAGPAAVIARYARHNSESRDWIPVRKSRGTPLSRPRSSAISGATVWGQSDSSRRADQWSSRWPLKVEPSPKPSSYRSNNSPVWRKLRAR